MSDNPQPQVHVVIRSGPGIVARHGSGLLAVLPGGSDKVQQQLLDAMQQACEGQALPGRTMARQLVGILSQADPDDVPAFGACAPNERGWAVILHQGVSAIVDHGGVQTTLSGFDASTWVDRIVDGGVESLTLLPDGEAVGEVDTRFRFQGGLVPGSGATILIEGMAEPLVATPGAAPPAPPAQPPAPPAATQPEAEPEMAPAADAAMEQPQAPVATETPSAAPPPAPSATPVAARPTVGTRADSIAPAPAPHPAPPVEAVQPEAMPDEEDEPPTLIQAQERDPAAGMPEAAEPQDLPQEDVPFESVLLADVGADARRAPLPVLTADTPKEDVEDEGAPLVYGVLSPTGYFNHPDALYCAVTGVSMLHRTHVLVQRPRPPLGVVVADDGSTFTLNSNYIVGREPERDPQVEADDARPLKLADAERSLSRVHAEIQLIDWDVHVVDRGSANGTYVLPRDGQQWKRLVADTPEKIVPGTRIAFGKRVLTFESHHQINQAAAS